jgi:hypothetical protein
VLEIVNQVIRIILFLLISHFTYSQILVQGKVVDTNNRPIPYVNIGILNSTFGTISNEDGSFSISIPDHYKSDSILFSALGYSRKHVSVTDAQQINFKVFLSDHVVYLEEVVVNTHRESNKYFEFGNSRSQGGSLNTDTLNAGAAFAILIDPKAVDSDFSFPVYLERAKIRILRNNLPTFKIRVRLYGVDTITNQPSEDLLHQSIVLESEIRNGWLEFDLSQLNFIVQDPFFLGFERLLTKADREFIATSFKKFINENPKKLKGAIDLPGTIIADSNTPEARKKFVCYSRNTSFDLWKQSMRILTATVTLSNQPTSYPNK